MHCDNRGVLNHGSQVDKKLQEKHAQFDVPHVMKNIIVIAGSPVTSSLQWVEGHSVEKKGLRNWTYPETMNNLVDELADVAFHRAIQLQNFIDSDSPFEKFWVEHKGKKIIGNLRRDIDTLTRERTAKKYFA